eukprot:7377486-Prymnesium_polylepis.1
MHIGRSGLATGDGLEPLWRQAMPPKDELAPGIVHNAPLPAHAGGPGAWMQFCAGKRSRSRATADDEGVEHDGRLTVRHVLPRL